MTCPHCQTPATVYNIEDGDEKKIVHECDGCHRRRMALVDQATGETTWAWLPKSGYCAYCRYPLWRFASDPRSGQPLLLWPGPEVVSAQFEHESGGRSQPIDYCPACLPAIGAPLAHLVTQVGEPLVFGACLAHIASRERYAVWFTDERRDFYSAWGRDHLHLDDTHHAAFMMQWQADRDEIMGNDERRGVATVAEERMI